MKRSFAILALFAAIAGLLLYIQLRIPIRGHVYRLHEPFQGQAVESSPVPPSLSRLPPPGQVPERGVASPYASSNRDPRKICTTNEDCASNQTKKMCVSGKCRN